jgi:cytochrome b6-f complex iron-sulfur subunit
MEKREFLKSASAATILTAFGLSLESCSSEKEPAPSSGNAVLTFDLTEAPYNQLQTDGQWLLVSGETLLMVNVGGTISVFSSVCTHQNCSTAWSFGTNATCGCHGSVFDPSGSPITGPATRPLTRKSVTREGDLITIT